MDVEKILSKYDKVVTMAQRGEPNEAANAAKIAATMRSKHEWLHDEWRRRQEQAPQESVQASGQGDSAVWDGLNWGRMWNVARETVNKAREFTQSMADTQYAIDVADEVAFSVREDTMRGGWRINTHFPEAMITDLHEMNEMQRRAFVEHVAIHYRAWLDELFLED